MVGAISMMIIKFGGLNKHTSLALGLMIMAAFSLMATSGILKYKEEERASWFSHKAEIAKPHYYSVYLADYDITAEVTPTSRAAAFSIYLS